MRRGVRAFSGGAEIEPDPDIVPGSMVSLQAAVRRGFESGAVVRVPPGTYRGTLILEGAITVVGTVAGAVMIVGESAPALIVRLPAGVAARAPAVRALTPSVHRLALSVDGAMSRAGRAATRAVLAVEVGSPTIRSCTIDATAVDGIAVIGASSFATITDTTVHGASGYGINAERRASISLERVEVRDAQVAGVRLMGGAITADRLLVHGGPMVGIVLSDKATGTLSRCEVAEIGRVGITIAGAGTVPTLRDTTVRDGAGTGILVSEDASPTLERCTVSGHAGAGIDVCTGADPTVRECTVRDGLAVGIRTRSGGRGTIERCTVTGRPSGMDLEVTSATRVVATGATGTTPRQRSWRVATREAPTPGPAVELTSGAVTMPSPTAGGGGGDLGSGHDPVANVGSGRRPARPGAGCVDERPVRAGISRPRRERRRIAARRDSAGG
jgi:parallel beta-helix repeat protein